MSQRILVVDDDQDALTLIGLTLKRQKFEVIKALSGPQALSLLAQELPDLIILDVMMPQMDGYEVCRHIKANPRTAHVPVVMLTARAQTDSQVEAFRAGADDYITKPVRPSELVVRVQAALEGSTNAVETQLARVISVSGAKGGVGATTLAVNLALALAAQARTILVDLEPNGMAAAHLGLAPLHGLGDLSVRATDEIDQASIEAALTPHISGLQLIAAAEHPLNPAQAGAILNNLLAICDVCLFDLGSKLSPAARTIAQRSHHFVLALDADRIALAQTNRMIQSLSQMGLPGNALKLVWINRLGISADTAGPAIRATIGHDLAATIEPAGEAMYQALEQGQPLIANQHDHPVAAQVRTLATLLLRDV
jgi:DNA-binding response OmpR family regulator